MDNYLLGKIVERAPDPIVIQADGKFAWMNPAALLLFGIKDSIELAGTLFTDSIHPDHHEEVRNRINRLNIDKLPVKSLEYRIIRRDGGEVWVESKGEAIEYEGINGGLLFMRDITSRKKTEEAYSSSEEILQSSYTLLRMAGKIAHFGGWSVDVNGRSDLENATVNWSDTVAGIHGTEPGKFPTVKEAVGFYAPRWRGKIASIFKDCVAKGIPFDEEMEIISLKGKKVWVRTIGEAVWDGEKVVKVQGAVQDITKIREAEQEVKNSEEKWRNIFLDHSAIKLIIDPESGKIVEANKAAARYYGWTVEEMKKMNISQINVLSESEIKTLIDQARNSENIHFNLRHRNADGTIKDVEVFSSTINVDGRELLHSVIHDITGKKTAERQLKLLSRSVEQSPVSIVITDLHGKIEYVNPVFETTSGYTMDEIRGKSLRMLKSGFHSQKFYDDLWNTILSGKDWRGEFRNKRKNGEYYWNHAVISPIMNSRGEVTNFVSVMEDITENKKMLAQLLEAKEKAEESNRLKSAFLANISHEIRTPMNGIMGFAEILKDSGLTRKNQLKFYDIIENSGKRMLDTVNDLIDISKIETGQVKLHLSEIDLSDQLDNLYDFFYPETRKKGLRLILNYRLPEEFSVMYTDRAKLNSILTNLVKNAIKFTDKGKIEFGCSKKGDSLEFYVADTGIGIPYDRRSAIFNRFEQADLEDVKAFQGSGLGLSLSKSYVEMLGGDIRLESEEGKGSTFWFTIPFKSAGSGNKEKKGKKVSDRCGIPELNGKTVLIAEDDLFSMEMLNYQLKKTGATLLLAKDGREAVQEFRKQRVDLVLLDIQMPEMNGYEVLKELSPAYPGIPFIAQTAYAMPEDIRKFHKAGFTDYLTKPISQDKLFSLLNKYLSSLYPTSGEHTGWQD